jgi:hypothetical protein
MLSQIPLAFPLFGPQVSKHPKTFVNQSAEEERQNQKRNPNRGSHFDDPKEKGHFFLQTWGGVVNQRSAT